MFTQQIGDRRQLALAAFVALALTAAVLAVAIQARSLGSSTIGPQVRGASTPAAVLEPPSAGSRFASRSCWRRKFGCDQDTITTSPRGDTPSRP